MKFLSSLGKGIDALFNKHMFVRRALVLWAMGLITWVVLRVFTDLEAITGHVVTALSVVVGLLTTGIGFYNYQRKLDAQERGTNVVSDDTQS